MRRKGKIRIMGRGRRANKGKWETKRENEDTGSRRETRNRRKGEEGEEGIREDGEKEETGRQPHYFLLTLILLH